MIAIVGNKSDCYEFEQVEDIEAKHLVKQLNGMFHKTSAKTGLGIMKIMKLKLKIIIGIIMEEL